MKSLSIIIPTRNRSGFLRNTLMSLQLQTLPSTLFEILVIDNGSTDNTKGVVTSLEQQFHKLRYFFEPKPGLHVGRHVGMKMAESEILVYADDDIEAFPTWLEAIHNSFHDKDVVLVGGKNLPKFAFEPPDWIAKRWETDENGNRILGYLSILDLGDEEKEINPYQVYGCNFSIRKSILLAAGGFHPDAMPQDLIRYRGDGESHVLRYVSERGYKAYYHPKASVYHMVPDSRLCVAYFCKRAYNQGISDSFTEIRNGAIRHLEEDKPEYGKQWKKRIVSKSKIIRAITRIGDRDSNIEEIKSKIKEAYWQGYNYHQEAVKSDSDLLAWVLKKCYYD